jgi:hypothetical protein
MKPSKSYPKSLHKYNIYYTNDTCKILFACGATNAAYISSSEWPYLEISKIEMLDDSWKN